MSSYPPPPRGGTNPSGSGRQAGGSKAAMAAAAAATDPAHGLMYFTETKSGFLCDRQFVHEVPLPPHLPKMLQTPHELVFGAVRWGESQGSAGDIPRHLVHLGVEGGLASGGRVDLKRMRVMDEGLGTRPYQRRGDGHNRVLPLHPKDQSLMYFDDSVIDQLLPPSKRLKPAAAAAAGKAPKSPLMLPSPPPWIERERPRSPSPSPVPIEVKQPEGTKAKESYVDRVLKTFNVSPAMFTCPGSKSLRANPPVQILRVLPHPDLWTHNYMQVSFDEDPFASGGRDKARQGLAPLSLSGGPKPVPSGKAPAAVMTVNREKQATGGSIMRCGFFVRGSKPDGVERDDDVDEADGLLGYYAHKSDYHVSVSSFQGAKKSSGNYVLEMPHPPDLSRLEITQANNTQQESQSQAIESQQLMPPSATATSSNKVKVARGEALLVPLATGRLPLKRAAERGGYGRRLEADFIRLGQRSLTEDEMKGAETKRLQIMTTTMDDAPLPEEPPIPREKTPEDEGPMGHEDEDEHDRLEGEGDLSGQREEGGAGAGGGAGAAGEGEGGGAGEGRGRGDEESEEGEVKKSSDEEGSSDEDEDESGEESSSAESSESGEEGEIDED
ncbi:unnamed protein product [Vitrella brassicaformis CCMP3155]|uniref:Uncharacterized protein n=3 Tax=Vitrella brassicaformis TaxID=1169539 RepID=A0A0G4EEG5_VITBC|nr:unnamed protein product [Vitrella brassicaformis CCMP3155]|eukprot:CEL93778.1 unnamed protein product [Vitrella brassicaformis CCMP3155]